MKRKQTPVLIFSVSFLKFPEQLILRAHFNKINCYIDMINYSLFTHLLISSDKDNTSVFVSSGIRICKLKRMYDTFSMEYIYNR